jgi:nicotinamide mononucleotide (NMN) deamidase PncC
MSNRAAALHRSAWQGVFTVTGGGSQLLAELLTEPGASATVLEATVPYASASLRQLLGAAPDQACSQATARSMAMAAFQRALELTSLDPDAGAEEQQTFGLACTASLATTRQKKGAHRAHIAVQTASSTYTVDLSLTGSREDEERQLLETLWASISRALDVPLSSSAPPGEHRVTIAPESWQALILGDASAHSNQPNDARLLLPGAFNPLHSGHQRMLQISEQITGHAGAYELSVANVDKPFLDYQEIERRLEAFDRPVWLTHLPTFIEKARHFPDASFVVGIDTLLRIADAAYYANEKAMLDVFAEFMDLNTGFIVFGRDLQHEAFKVLDDVIHELPASLASLCAGVDAATFAESISSTELRRQDR